MMRHFGHEFAIIAIVCVLGIFLFPAAVGSYSAVHGPVTALQAMRRSIRLRWAMAFAALTFLTLTAQFLARVLQGMLDLLSSATAPPAHSPLLRC
ncbi:MAG TPA: hypothetical protein VF133_09565 [Terriglobales bacterium]